MTLPTFKKKDEIPKGFESMYEEVDGQWVPKEVEDTSEITKQLAAAEKQKAAAEKLSNKLANDLKALQNKVKAAEDGVPEEVAQKIRADVKAELEAEYAPKLKDAETTAAENRALKLDGMVKIMLAEAGFLPAKVADVWKLHRDEFDLSTDGKPIVKGKPASDLKKYIEGLKANRTEWVKGSEAGGGGAAGIQQQPSTDKQVVGTPEQRLAAAHASGAKG